MSGARSLQCRAERHRCSISAEGQPLRAGCRRAVRPGREQPALRHRLTDVAAARLPRLRWLEAMPSAHRSSAANATISARTAGASCSRTGRSPTATTGRAHPRSWVAGSGLDAWVIQRDVQDPASLRRDLAARRRRAAIRSATAASYDAWLSTLESRGVLGIGFGLITLRSRRPRHPSAASSTCRRRGYSRWPPMWSDGSRCRTHHGREPG